MSGIVLKAFPTTPAPLLGSQLLKLLGKALPRLCADADDASAAHFDFRFVKGMTIASGHSRRTRSRMRSRITSTGSVTTRGGANVAAMMARTLMPTAFRAAL